MTSKNNWRSQLGHWLHQFHLIPALVLASALFVIEQHHYLNWIDAAMLQVSQRYSPAPGSVTETEPVVLAISDVLYESEFNQTSPLERGRLAGMLRQLLENRPRVLAIDLDLSPSPVPDAGQAALDDLLLTARDKFPDTRVVIITPFPSVSPHVRQQKAVWMRRMCDDAALVFALPTLLLQQGTVLKYEKAPALEPLGVLAAGQGRGVCKAFGDGGGVDLPDELHTAGTHTNASLRPINYRYFDGAAPVVLDKSVLPKTVRDSITQKIVFLGGAYGQSDLHATPHGDVPGVLIHAAIAYSEAHPVGVLPHIVGFAVDVLLGVCFGLLFSLSWGYYFRAKASSATSERAVFWLGLNLMMMLGGLLAVTLAASWLIHRGWWLNPAPMILGMFLDTLLAKEPHAAYECEVQHPPGRLAQVLVMTKWLLVAGIVGWAITLLMQHH
jgi:CHASE2 domain-containing sensor protein